MRESLPRVVRWIIRLAGRFHPVRTAPFGPAEFARHNWPTSTKRLGLRMSERLRDAWRRRWLRITRDDHG